MESKILKSCSEIARTFGVRKDIVKEWLAMGAPIAVVNGALKAGSAELMHWLVAQGRKGEARE